ncbi:MAG: SusC/RagA family TonB-linked outer membrane protein [Saprospiraceae bacterium]|nr:SusC/RagA family TonB-linked outer membrane protein [Saprospiraceae bacterium]
MNFLHTFSKGGLLVAVLLLFGNLAMAQRTVKGKVTDAESGEGLIGATVTVVGTTRGAVTDIDGNYSVEVPAGSTQLRFAYTGYAEEEVALSTSNAVDIALKPGTVLDEVVVVGYGTLKSREITSSVASVKAENFNKGNVNDVTALIQGKVAGLVVARAGNDPNGSFNVRLRGLSTTSQNTSPLIVIDGVPAASLRQVDPNDIESIDVLKDGSAAAIYGTRASSGVILITTRKGQVGKSTVDYHFTASVDQIAKKLPLLSGADYVNLAGGDNLGSNTDWLDEVSQNGRSMIHGLNMTGGTAKTSYRVSLNYRDIEGIAKGTGFSQYNANVSLQQKALDNRLTLSANVGSLTRDADIGFKEAFRYAAVYNPTAPVRSDNATYAPFGGYFQFPGSFDQFNPVAIIEQGTNKDKIGNLFANVKADLQIIPGLTFSVFYNQTRETKKHTEFDLKQAYYRGRGGQGSGLSQEESTTNNLFESTMNYEKKFGKVGLKLLGGYTWQEFTKEGFASGPTTGNNAGAGNILLNELGTYNAGAFVDYYNGLAIPVSFRDPDHRIIAFFGRVNLNYDDTYFLTASLRREGSSRFGVNNRWGLFPAVSAGVALNNFFMGETFNNLKLRVGYGVTGGIPREGALSVDKVGPLGAFFYDNGKYLLAYGPVGTNANPDLKWEKKADVNIGVDWAIMDYKLSGSLEYYQTNTTDLLYPFNVPVPPNFNPVTWLNVGELKNNGIEATINYNAIQRDNLSWNTGLTFSTYHTELVDLYEDFETLPLANVGAPGLNGEYYIQVAKGQPVGNLFVRDFVRINDEGKYVFRDANGAETTDPDKAAKVVAGNGLPKFDLGWTNSVSMGNFDLQFFLRGVFGHSLANEYRVFYESLDPDTKTWNKVNTKYFDTRLKAKNAPSSYQVEKADFVRLENITLGYNVKLPAGSWFTHLRLFVNAQNPFVITGYSGVDPEVRFSDVGSVDNGGRPTLEDNPDPLAPGIDRRSTYFRARTFSLGVNVGL